MNPAIYRWFSLILFCLLFTGCSNLNMANPLAPEDAQLFAQGLDQHVASGDLATLKLLSQKYPQGQWRVRAEAIISLAEQQQQQQARLEELEKELALQKVATKVAQERRDKEIAELKMEKGVLIQDNQMLEVTLERLKEALIDMELQPK